VVQVYSQPVVEKLLTVLRRHLKSVDGAQAIPMDQRLEELGLDSLGAVNLLLDLEDSFTISFPDSLLTEETFRTASNLYQSVYSLTGSN
jgi:acyl carrier protein